MTSKYRGVSWHVTCKKWIAKITHNGNIYKLGYFASEIEAAEAYDKKAIELKGDKAKTNFNKISHKCEVKNCNNLAIYKYKGKTWLCKKHISQINKTGNILNHTKFDANELIILNDKKYCEIVLYDKNNIECAKSLIDSKNINKVKGHKWYLRSDGYVACNNYNGKYTYLHNLIIDNNFNYTDHKDRNRLNNTEENLRCATGTQNGMNKGIRIDNTSGKVGVHWSKQNDKWCAMIGYNKKRKNLGYFDEYEDAVTARINAEKEYFKNFKPINESS